MATVLLKGVCKVSPNIDGEYSVAYNHASMCAELVCPSGIKLNFPLQSTPFSYHTLHSTPPHHEQVTGVYDSQGMIIGLQILTAYESVNINLPLVGDSTHEPILMEVWDIQESMTKVVAEPKVVVENWVVPDWD